MKNRLITNFFRKLKKNYKRFLSLLCMSLLGVGFYAGIKACAPDLLNTLDVFYDNNNVYDLKISSTLGLTNEDLKEIKELSYIQDAVLVNETDKYIHVNENNYVAKILPLSNMATPEILKGNKPQNQNEILVEEQLIKDHSLKIGDYIQIDTASGSKNSFKIVGTVVSPLYFSNSRGTTSLGSGTIDYYIYADNVDNNSIYSSIYLTVKKAKNLLTNTDDYNSLIKQAKKEIEDIQENQEQRRFNEVYSQIIDYATLTNTPLETFDLAPSQWYITDRNDISAYKDMIDASNSIAQVGNVFPLIFFIIAVLISLISMMRMVEEDRSENGTLKALGFSNKSIYLNYFFYSLLAVIIGGVVGIIAGIYTLPLIIWSIYDMLFAIPTFHATFNYTFGIIGILISFICICGTALFVAISNLKSVPASLMRPKAPKSGKRILLERITFIWKRLKFSNKILIRNIFRYKSRVAASIIGITGCSALILAGFGLRDSISAVAGLQFDHIFTYDEMLTLANNDSELINSISSEKNISQSVEVHVSSISLKLKSNEKDVTLVTPLNTLEDVITLEDVNSEEKLKIEDNKIILGEKTAKELDAQKGSKITLKDSLGNDHILEVQAITPNYVSLYAYINKNTFENLIGSYTTNVLYLKFKNNDPNKIEDFNNQYAANNQILSIINTQDTVNSVLDMMNSLNLVVVILIIAAALLAFVVLYNLSNININERQREIATLKVLGFYNKEVDSYITKENIILTIIGIILGLIGGYILTQYLLITCETDEIMFGNRLKIISYLIAAFITILFTIIINIITHFNLKKINMIESLKNVE